MLDRILHKLQSTPLKHPINLVCSLDEKVVITSGADIVFDGTQEEAIAYLVDRKRGQHSGTCVVRMDSDRDDDMDV